MSFINAMLSRMEHWAAVVRVSHMGDRKAGSATFHADRDQVAEVERYAVAYPEKVELTFLAPELSVSGGRAIEDRPSLKEAIEGVESGGYTAIITANLKRLTRSRSGYEIWERVEAAGGRVHCAAENIDTSTPNGRFIRDIHLAEAVREREEHQERFDARCEHATAAGIWQRRQTPRGYRKDPRTRKLVPDARADEVRDTFRAYLTGATISDLARRLRMTKSGVRQLLRNRVYLGELRVRKHVNASAYDALIDVETFEAVQAKLASGVRPGRNGGAPALLAGLVRCSSCGHLMTRTGSNGGPVYACPKKHSGKSCPDPAYVMMGRLDSYVIPVALRELSRLRVSATEGNGDERDRAELAAAERELAAYLSAVSAADVGTEAFAAGARERREKIDAVAEQMRVKRARGRAVPPQVGTGAEVWEDLNAHDRNALLRALLKAVVVCPTGGDVVPIAQRARVVAFGVELELARRGGGEAAGIVPIPFHDLDGVGVLGVAASKDAAQGTGSAV